MRTIFFLQSRRRAPLVTAPPDDLDTQQAGFRNSVACYDPPTGRCSTDLPEFYSKTTEKTEMRELGPSRGETSQPLEVVDGNFTEQRQNPRQSTSFGSCRRVGLRRVGLGCKRDLPSSDIAMSQTRKQFSQQKSNSYRPPTAPDFVANSLSGDVRIPLFYNYS